MNHICSIGDEQFRRDFECGEFPLTDFDHRAHIRLAYVYLVSDALDQAHVRMREALMNYLAHQGITSSKYHETITRAWLMAVRYFMSRTDGAKSADKFIQQNPIVLDSKIMLTHYSAEVLFSKKARQRFVKPDIDPIPELHG